MNALDKIFEVWYANSDQNMTRQDARSVFDSTMSNASDNIKNLIARSSTTSVRAVSLNLPEESLA